MRWEQNLLGECSEIRSVTSSQRLKATYSREFHCEMRDGPLHMANINQKLPAQKKYNCIIYTYTFLTIVSKCLLWKGNCICVHWLMRNRLTMWHVTMRSRCGCGCAYQVTRKGRGHRLSNDIEDDKLCESDKYQPCYSIVHLIIYLREQKHFSFNQYSLDRLCNSFCLLMQAAAS